MRKRKASNLSEGVVKEVMDGSKQKFGHDKDKLINDANSLTLDEFKKLYIKHESLKYIAKSNGSDQAFHIDFVAAPDLTSGELLECYNLIKSTSRHDYEGSSFGWHPKRKKREMKEDEMRYLLVRSSTNSIKSEKDENEPIQAFLSFMLTHDSAPSMPVLYIYEIHLQKQLRQVGLGKHLMDIVEGTAEKVGVEKVMLTCFLSNTLAHSFYERRGYAADVSSPEDRSTRGKTVKADYVIMSKAVQYTANQPATSEGLDIFSKGSNG